MYYFGRVYIWRKSAPASIVAGPGVEPGLRDYEPHVHRTLSRAMRPPPLWRKRQERYYSLPSLDYQVTT